MKVLVTGGAGWIGQATIRALEARGHESVIFDRTHSGDIRDAEAVDMAVARVDHVIHLAGVLGTHELFEHAGEAVTVNVLGGLNIVTACVTFEKGLTEITMPRVNPSLYAATKACAMDIARAYVDAGMLRASFVRAYNAYGPGQAYGGDHPQKIVPTFASKAWADEALPVWGDGQLATDLVHVDDVARMLVEAMDHGDGVCFDAGSGHLQRVIDVANTVIEIVGKGKVEHLQPRLGERKVSTPDDVAKGEGWDRLNGWRPVFDPQRFVEAVNSYKP